MRTLVVLIITLVVSLASEAQSRKALVVGVGEYHEVHDLPKTIADANAYEVVLANDLGFEVTKLIDPTFDDFYNGLDTFLETIQKDDQVAFIFSGHGWSDGSQNYLALKDAPLKSSERILQRLSAAVNADVLDEIRARNPSLVFAVIDACRNNPFDLGKKSVAKGLIPQQTIPGTVVVYAAGANEEALERLNPSDENPNSVFTRTLLPKLKEPATPLMRIISEARDETDVLASSVSHQQRPAVYTDLSIDFCFAESCPQLKEALDEEKAKSNMFLSNIFEAGSQEMFREENGDHTRSMLMAIYARKFSTSYPATSFVNLARMHTENALLRVYTGHSDYVVSVALSEEGNLLATGSMDKTAKLWSTETRALLKSFEGHSDSVLSVALSRDGKRLVTSSSDNTTKLWNTETGALLHSFEGHSDSVLSVALSEDGKRLATGSWDYSAKLWDTETGTLLQSFEGHSSPIFSVALSNDGERLVTGSSDNIAKLWDTETGKLLQTFEGHLGSVTSVALSEDGKRLATGSWDGTARIWDIENGTLLQSFEGHLHPIHSVALSDDGKRLITGSADYTAKLWDLTLSQLDDSDLDSASCSLLKQIGVPTELTEDEVRRVPAIGAFLVSYGAGLDTGSPCD